METPDAQLNRRMTYTLDLAAFGSGFDDAGVALLARAARTPLIGYDNDVALVRQSGLRPRVQARRGEAGTMRGFRVHLEEFRPLASASELDIIQRPWIATRALPAKASFFCYISFQL